MGTKTVEIEHEGGHFLAAPVLEKELAEAATAAGVPDGWTVKRSETQAGVSTKVTVEFEGELGEPDKVQEEPPQEDPVVLAGETKTQARKARPAKD